MADQSTQSITIDASPAAIMAVIADFPRYPEWAASITRADVLEEFDDGRAKRVQLTIDARVFRDQYELEYVWTDQSKVEWTLVKGQMQKAQHGSYTLLPSAAEADDATEVTYSLSVDLFMPMLGMLKRKAERVIMDTALKELKKRVEATG